VDGVGSPIATITDLLVSCRALKRGVEQAVVAFVLRRVHEAGARELSALFRPTARNAPFAAFYEELGFRRGGPAADGAERFVRPVLPALEMPSYLTVVAPTGSRV
jgi:predicted enzyme involved in methoxymalonyl-ACP biosynthesis